MKFPKAYLCGPINGCTDDECNIWRQYWKDNYRGDVIDPMRRDYRGKELENFRQIVEFDKIDVASADVLVINSDRPSSGADMETILAWMWGKLVVLICPPNANLSPWRRYHTHHIVHSNADAIAILENLT